MWYFLIILTYYFRQRSRSFYDCIPKNKLTLFHSSKKKENSKSQNELTLAKNDAALFSKLYIGCQNRDGDIDEFFKHENQAFPPSLSDFGKLRATVKSELLTCFEALSPPKRELPNGVSVVILDGAAIVQLLKVVGVSTYEQYANDIFKPYVTSILRAVDRVDIVWDSYKADSLKASTRENVEKASVDGSVHQLLYRRTGKISYELMTINKNYFISSPIAVSLGHYMPTKK